MNDFFHVAHMTPVLHCECLLSATDRWKRETDSLNIDTMGGLEIDPQSRVLDKDQKPIVRALPHSITNQVVAIKSLLTCF